MILRDLQRLLAVIYDVPLAHDVCDFLVTERRSSADEQLLVAQEGAVLRLGLYIDGDVLTRLEHADPTAALHGGNLADCWTALEGVSHFVYLAWNAGHDKPVSLLELELQAEIDKYVVCWWLLRAQDPRRFPHELHRLLFERARVDAVLAAERAPLYVTANRYAARFCRRIARGLQRRSRESRRDLVAELRRFYRLGSQRKLRHIEHHA